MLAAAQCAARVAEILVAAGTVAGPRVYTSRTWPLDEASLPAYLVTAESEAITPETLDFPYLQQHDLQIALQAFARHTTTLDASLHELAEQAIAALFASAATAQLQPLQGCELRLQGIDRFMSKLGPADVGQATVQLGVRFHTLANAPGAFA